MLALYGEYSIFLFVDIPANIDRLKIKEGGTGLDDREDVLPEVFEFVKN